MCGATDAVSMIEVPLEKYADLSYVQINILKNVAKMASTVDELTILVRTV